MRAALLDGRALATREQGKIKEAVQARLAGGLRPPGLAVILVGNNPASAVYVANKEKACALVGIRSFPFHLEADTSQEYILDLIARLNADNAVDGILVQLPLPAPIHTPAVLSAVDPSKDADGFHPLNLGKLLGGDTPAALPCTPTGILRLIEASGRQVAGAHAVVVGRSSIVGKPVSLLLLAQNATVTICHSATADLGKITRQGDILVVAAGKPGLIKADMVKEGAVVIDVGINRVDDHLVGDVDFEEVAMRAGFLTPVPGGVGPMTIAMLLSNTLANAEQGES